jgi:t-SNARE complex subunit (syntaxin)
MTETQSLVSTIHDAIDEITTAVEDIHKSVAGVPIDVLKGLTPLDDAMEEARAVQTRSIGAVYELVRKINGRVRDLTTGEAATTR